MTVINKSNTPTKAVAAPPRFGDAPRQPLPAAALDGIAARLRVAGLFLLVARPDGTISYHDAQAGAFFRRYVLPALQLTGPRDGGLTHQPGLLMAPAEGGVWPVPPGVLVSACPFAEKRHAHSLLLLAARSAAAANGPDVMQPTEDVLRLCGRLGLDATWLAAEARNLPAYGEQALHRQGRMVAEMLRDALRLSGLERELDSLSGQLADTYEELSLIYQISGGMKVNRRASDFFRQACLDLLDVMDVRGIGVALDCEIGSRMEPAVYGPKADELPAEIVLQLHAEMPAEIRGHKGPLLVNDLAAHRTLRWLEGHATRLLAVPLQRQDQVLGCLFALDKKTDDFDSVDAKLLMSIGNELAIYLENAMLFEDVHGLMMGLLHSLTSAVDAKDAYTCGHSERVALVSRHLAQQMGLGERDVEQVYMAGLLHDVGKIGVPEAVLQKAGKLTAEEFEQIKKHPEIGARILQDVKQIRDIVPGVLHHHERYDGKGYPMGLAGQDIPLLGRVICLADCFDAMTSSRTYRRALPLEVALTEIRRCSGTQFDPALAETFLRTGPEGFRELLRDHREKAKKLRAFHEGLRAG
jgi:putative nucleotidyltransferase with HDIG domain